MNVHLLRTVQDEYPDSDGEPLSDTTWQFDWISIIKWNLEVFFRKQMDVYIAANNLIYAVEGEPKIRQAPDVYVAFGRPKHNRGSYRVWREEGIFPRVVFEVWSPNNRPETMRDKFNFYQQYGAEEYYIVYPEFPHIEGWIREGPTLVKVPNTEGFFSPRMHIQFGVENGNVAIDYPNGRAFLHPVELIRTLEVLPAFEIDYSRVADNARRRIERYKQKLRELGVDPDSL